jgi:GNAT superfamily N-acetyltransferase
MPYWVTEANLQQDADAIIEFWGMNLGVVSSSRFVWKYRDNPAGKATCRLLRESKAALLGTATLLPRCMKVGHKMMQCGQAVDLAVDRRHRLGGAAMKLERSIVDATERGGCALAYAFPNDKSAKVMQRAGFTVSMDVERWTRPLRSGYKLARWIRSPFLHRLATRVIDSVLRIDIRSRSFVYSKTFVTEVVTTFDARFDELWFAAAPQFSIIGERSSDFLMWRFAWHPEVGYRVFCLSRNMRLLGYVVFHVSNNSAVVADFLFRDRACLSMLFRTFVDRMRKEGFDAVVVNYVGPKAIGAALRMAGFFKRKEKNQLLIHWPRATDLAAGPSQHDAGWYFTHADRDV